MNTNKIRNLGIVAHVDAGKTTITERILYYTGETHKFGEVHEGKAHTDFTAEEKAHGITIFSAATSVYWKQHKLTIIDTPGHIDFNIEVNRALRVLDGAVVVFDGVAGVEPQSETNWRLADHHRVPRIAFVNKMDRVGANFFMVADRIRERLGIERLITQLPIGQASEFSGVVDLVSMKALRWDSDDIDANISTIDIPEHLLEQARDYRQRLVERVVEFDEQAMLAFVNGDNVDTTMLQSGIRRGTLAGKLVPLLCGSAFKNKGVQPLLDAMVDYLPAPEDRREVIAQRVGSHSNVTIESDANQPFVALAFKLVSDKHGALTFLRVYSGQCESGDYVLNTASGKRERIGRIYEMHAQKRLERGRLQAGDIVALLGLKHTKTGDTLCANDFQVELERIEVPQPVIGMAIEAKRKQDQDSLLKVLQSFVLEDPSLQLGQNPETGQLILSGMGELHLAMRLERLNSEYQIEAKVGKPHVAYRETVNKSIETNYLHKKQKGGPGQFAEIRFKLEPLPRGGGIEFENRITGGAIPQEYVPSIETGMRKAAESGIVANYPMTDFKVTLLDGSYHEQDSSTRAFEIAAQAGFRQAAQAADAKLLEPIMAVEITTAADYVGDCIGDISRRRGSIRNQENRGTGVVLQALIPLSKMFGYIGDLRAISSGRASFSMAFDHYDIVPDGKAIN